MNIKDIMNQNVESIEMQMSAKEAMQKMIQYGFDALPVMERGQLMGMVSYHDILQHLVSDSQNLERMKVSDIMTKQVQFCMDSDDLSKAAEIMCRHRLHGLPVLGQSKQLMGFISLDDFVKKAHDERLSYQILSSIGYGLEKK